MNLYRMRFDVNLYRGLELVNEYDSQEFAQLIDLRSLPGSYDRLNQVCVQWNSYGKRRSLPDFASMNDGDGLIGLSAKASEFIRQHAENCGERIETKFVDDPRYDLFLVHGQEVLSREHEHDWISSFQTFHTEIDQSLAEKYCIFRKITFPAKFIDSSQNPVTTMSSEHAEEMLKSDDYSLMFPKGVGGLDFFCNGSFKDLYHQAELSGLYFEPYWPLEDFFKDRIHRICNEAIAEEKRKRLKTQPKLDSSKMPKGRVRKPKVTWEKNQRPDAEQLAAYLWQDIIDERMNGRWLTDAVSAQGPDALGITNLAATAMEHLNEQGVDKTVLCHLARSICWEAICRTFRTLEETGIAWPDGKPDWESLLIAMTQEATIGKDGSIGGWPAK